MYLSEVSFGPVEDGDAEYVAERLREADRVEVYEATRRSPEDALTSSIKRSDRTATIRFDGSPMAIFGVGKPTILSDVGVPWMLGTDELPKHARELLPHGPRVVQNMMRGHEVLRNMVHDENRASIRWLKSMGFRMSEPAKVGWRGGMFRMFEIRKDEI